MKQTSFSESLIVQARVIGALIMREIITRFGRHNIGFLWLFVEPMMFTLGIATLWYVTKASHGHDVPIVEFALTGYSTVLLWRNCATRCVGGLKPNLSLLFHRNVKPLDVFLARIILEIAGATASFYCLTVVFWLFGLAGLPAHPARVIVAWGLTAFLSTGLGLFIGAVSELSEVAERVWHTVTYLLFPFSGAVFMVDWLPAKAREAVLLLPWVHGVEMLRSGYLGDAYTYHYSTAFMCWTASLLMLGGLLILKVVHRRVEAG
ncbi:MULTISPECIES: ABC transporter permease [Burkholderia]|uniref:ABC transporter permease n=1 Tax=Burkholderia TaxID=32008 RepID=UPI0005B6F848|nr:MULTISPECIES: ABC transporter permease [Burkholderia]KIP17073.1 ABC-2 type transporter family protein [Burkholderia sp. MSHR3999]